MIQRFCPLWVLSVLRPEQFYALLAVIKTQSLIQQTFDSSLSRKVSPQWTSYVLFYRWLMLMVASVSSGRFTVRHKITVYNIIWHAYFMKCNWICYNFFVVAVNEIMISNGLSMVQCQKTDTEMNYFWNILCQRLWCWCSSFLPKGNNLIIFKVSCVRLYVSVKKTQNGLKQTINGIQPVSWCAADWGQLSGREGRTWTNQSVLSHGIHSQTDNMKWMNMN